MEKFVKYLFILMLIGCSKEECQFPSDKLKIEYQHTVNKYYIINVSEDNLIFNRYDNERIVVDSIQVFNNNNYEFSYTPEIFAKVDRIILNFGDTLEFMIPEISTIDGDQIHYFNFYSTLAKDTILANISNINNNLKLTTCSNLNKNN